MQDIDEVTENIDHDLYPVIKYIKIAGGWWLLSLILLSLTVFIITRPAIFAVLDYSNFGQVGDTLGGVSAPFIGTAAAILTFLAFYMQLKANEMHSRQFLLEKKDRLRDKHEERIFFLIAQNRQIVENMTISDTVTGVRCFSQMYTEYRAIFEIVKGFYGNRQDDDFLANISYLILYNGLTISSDQINEAVFKDVPGGEELLAFFNNIIKIGNEITGLDGFEAADEIASLLSQLEYEPFQGHIVRLGQYFRNFFHILKYTTSVPSKIMSSDDKYEIIKSLRSQITSDEQMVIYFNSISFYGTPMREADYIIAYQLIKNIPLPQVLFAGDIRKRYKDLEFEWDEIATRAESGGAVI